MKSDLESSVRKLLAYCRTNDWAGIDPYDALNSPAISSLPFLNSRWPRIALTQALKRTPINVRPLLRIPNTQNPKALACFLGGLLKLSNTPLADTEGSIDYVIDRIRVLRSPDTSYWCWGYSFPWQTRKVLVPRFAPNVVCTCFVAGALLDAFEMRQDADCLEMARSAADYIVDELYWADQGACGFAYPLPSVRARIPNSNFLAAAFLARVCRHTGNAKYLAPALSAARHSAARQRPDGGWFYGELPSQQWIDNFHTGYNLCALREVDRYAGTSEFEERIRRGLEFYKANFFTETGAVKYFHDRSYPFDAHCIAQSILTLVTLKDLDSDNLPLANSVLEWAMQNLWDERGFFYYRKLRFLTVRTSYMRWTQAWMFLAMATLFHSARTTPGPELSGPEAIGTAAAL